MTKRPYFNGIIMTVISLWSLESHAVSPTRHCSVFGVAAPGTSLHSCIHPAGRLAFSLHHLGGKREERLPGRGHTTPTSPHSPGLPPSNQLSAGLPPCCHVALELSQQCGVVARQGEGSSSCLIPLLLTVSLSRPGSARLDPARPGPSQPRTHLS